MVSGSTLSMEAALYRSGSPHIPTHTVVVFI